MVALLMSLLTNPAVVGSLVTGVGSLAWYLVSKRTAAAQNRFTLAASLASQVLNDVAKRTDTKLDDQLAVFVGEIARSLEAQGKEMKPADVDKAKELFRAMHGVEPK